MKKKTKVAPISQQLRQLIEECGMSRNQLARETGVAKSTLSKFINKPEFSLSLDSIDKLGTYLGWTITAPQKGAEKSQASAARRGSATRGRKGKVSE